MNQWNSLITATQLKGLRIKQAIQAQQFYRSLADLDLWLREAKHEIDSKDFGRDLASVIILKRRINDTEQDWDAKRPRIQELKKEMDNMIKEGHFDADSVKENGMIVIQTYLDLEKPIEERKKRLDEELKIHEMRRELDDEEQWIREKELALNARKQIPPSIKNSNFRKIVSLV
jgi:hypothetical protein